MVEQLVGQGLNDCEASGANLSVWLTLVTRVFNLKGQALTRMSLLLPFVS